MFTNMETSTPITVPKKKFPFLKRGTAARRLKERSLSNTSRQAPEMRQPLGPISTHTSNQSLPIIENLSPIPHQPPPLTSNARPRTAETNDSGVRDLQTFRTPSNPSSECSMETVQTKLRNHTTTNSSAKIPDVDKEYVERLNRIAPNCVEQAEEKIDRAQTASPSNSFTSLDRVATPPIQTNPCEDEQSDYSARVEVHGTELDGNSVTTSRHDNDEASVSIIETRNHRKFNDDFDGTLTSRRPKPKLTKSYSYDDRSTFHHPSFLKAEARKEGIPLPHNYILPDRPKQLFTPTMNNKSVTFANTSHLTLFQTPLLRKPGRGDAQLENLAEQLRALLLRVDVAWDMKNQRLDQLRFALTAKRKDLERQANELKERVAVDEKKLIREKSKLKLEADKSKEKEDLLKQMEAEMREIKSKYSDTARNLSDVRISRDQMKQKYSKLEAELKAEKEKNEKLRDMTNKLTNDIMYERKVRTLHRQQQHQQPPPPTSSSRQPLQPLQQRTNRLGSFSKPQKIQPFILPDASVSKQPKHSSTSSSGSTAKAVHWSSPLAESTHYSSDPFENTENYTSLRMMIPDELRPANTLSNPVSIEEIYTNFCRFRIMKQCKCESIKYENGDYQYLCLENVNVSVLYWKENGQVTIQLPGDYRVISFPSKQLEIHRPGGEKSIVNPAGRRYEYLNLENYQNQAMETFDSNEWKRALPDGTVENIPKNDTKTTIRNENDFVQHDENIFFKCPSFSITRPLDDKNRNYMGAFNIKVYGSDPNKYWQLNVCPVHHVAVVKHCTNRNSNRPHDKVMCFFDGNCEHIQTTPTTK